MAVYNPKKSTSMKTYKHPDILKAFKAEYLIILTGLIIGFSSCSPIKKLPEPAEVGAHKYGAIIRMQTAYGATLQGELIAVTDSSIFFLSQYGLTEIKPNEMRNAELRVAMTHGRLSTIYIWGSLNILNSLIYGWLSVFAFPANLAVSTITMSSANRSYYYIPLLEYDLLQVLPKFARFPQGFPEGLDLRVIQ